MRDWLEKGQRGKGGTAKRRLTVVDELVERDYTYRH